MSPSPETPESPLPLPLWRPSDRAARAWLLIGLAALLLSAISRRQAEQLRRQLGQPPS